jgi:hypothetical protein
MFSLCSSLTVRDKVPHPHKRGKIIVCCTSIFWGIANGKTKDSALNYHKHSPSAICSLFLHKCNFDLLGLFPNIWIVLHFQWIYYLKKRRLEKQT